MEELNICPYCGRKMELGFIHGDRYILKWVPEKRNKRLAHSLTHHFVNECIDNGCMPQWDCMDSNVASKRTAERAEFQLLKRNIVYWFEI